MYFFTRTQRIVVLIIHLVFYKIICTNTKDKTILKTTNHPSNNTRTIIKNKSNLKQPYQIDFM